MTAVDDRMRRVEEKIENPALLDALATEQPGEEFAKFRPDAGQRVERGEERIEESRAHGGQSVLSGGRDRE